jgi:predicted nucleic acid-binding protein
MTFAYFETSALLKLCVKEDGTELADALWKGADGVATSRIADGEVRATILAGGRAGVLSETQVEAAHALWASVWQQCYVLDYAPAIAQAAARVIAQFPLRASDAIHVASALALHHDDVVLATWDKAVAAPAQALGLQVVPRP